MSFRRELKLSILISLYGLTPQNAQLSKKHHNRKIFTQKTLFFKYQNSHYGKEGRRKKKRKLVTGLIYASIRTPTWYLA